MDSKESHDDEQEELAAVFNWNATKERRDDGCIVLSSQQTAKLGLLIKQRCDKDDDKDEKNLHVKVLLGKTMNPMNMPMVYIATLSPSMRECVNGLMRGLR